MNRVKWVIVPCMLIALSACSNTKDQLGLTRDAPDEFKVVKHAPLEMPPGYSLRPPAPGTPRPQEQSPDVQAKQTVFGESAVQAAAPVTSDAESVLLQETNANIADPNIRQKIDSEFRVLNDNEKTVVEKLTGIVGDDEVDASIVDAKAEARRILDNKKAGKPITEGETPAIED